MVLAAPQAAGSRAIRFFVVQRFRFWGLLDCTFPDSSNKRNDDMRRQTPADYDTMNVGNLQN